MNVFATNVTKVRRERRPVVPGITGKSVAKLLRVLEKEAPKWNAPIVALAAQQNQSPFLTLIGCILSLRTKDQMTAVACERLFAQARTPEAMLAHGAEDAGEAHLSGRVLSHQGARDSRHLH